MAREKIIKVNSSSNIDEVFPRFVASQTAKGLSDKTIKTYFNHYHSISKHLDTSLNFNELDKSNLDDRTIRKTMLLGGS